jgi:nucleoid-associated protein YgaU
MANRKKSAAVSDQRSAKSPEAATPDASAMAREVKIGVTVIGLLVVVFSAALFWRFSRSDDESKAAENSAGPVASEAENLRQGAEHDSDGQPVSAQVVEARTGSPDTLGELPRADPNPWSPPSADGATDGAERAADALPALTYMPREESTPTAGADEQGFARAANTPVAWQTQATGDVEALDATQTPTLDTPASDASGGSTTGGLVQAAPGPLPQVGVQPAGQPSVLPPEPAVLPATGAAGPATLQTGAAAEPQWNAADSVARSPSGIRGSSADSEAPLPPAPLAGAYSTFKAPDAAGDGSSSAAYATPAGAYAAAANPGSPQSAADHPAGEGTYIVQPNDNYWIISQNVYGTGAFFQALAEHNREIHEDPNRLRLGETISVPGIEQLEKLYPDLCPRPEHRLVAQRHKSVMHPAGHIPGGRIYVVQEGDTLFDIARHELGKASRYGELIERNRDMLGGQYHYLTPGMQLVLPPDNRTAPQQVTSRPGDVYQR